MKRLAVFLLFVLIISSFVSMLRPAGASTLVSGLITANTTWTCAGSPYIVTGNVWVLPGVVLIIEPGVTVKFNSGTSLTVDGQLIARGNSTDKIVFTSNSIVPKAGDWSGISIRGNLPQELKWAVVQYGGAVSGNCSVSKCVFSNSTGGIGGLNLNVTNSVFRFLETAVGGGGTVENCVFENNNVGVSGGDYTSLRIVNCSFARNALAIDCVDTVIQDCQIINNTQGIGLVTDLNQVLDCNVQGNLGTGIYNADSQALIENTNVTGNGGDGIGGDYGVSTIRNCNISNNKGNGISAACSSVFDSEISNNLGQAVTMFTGALSGCNVTGNLGGGVTAWNQDGGRMTIDNSTISSNLFGIYFRMSDVDAGSSLSVSTSKIIDNTNGGIVVSDMAHRSGWSLAVANTIIKNNGRYGIKTNTTGDYEAPPGTKFYIPSVIINSIISNHTIGAEVAGTVSGCKIVGNTIGIQGPIGSISNSSVCNNSQIGLDIAGGTLHWNNIFDNGLYNVRTSAGFGTIVNATNNWWGTTNENTINQFIYDYYDDYNLALVLYKPYLAAPIPEHYYDLAVTSIQPGRTIVGQGSNTNISVTVANQGDFTETFNVTVYANTTIIGQTRVTLTSRNSKTLIFTWNISGFAKGNYTIRAYAWPVPDETNTANNTYTGGMVKVTIPGDTNGDKKVNVLDLILIAFHLGHSNGDGHTPYSPDWYKCMNTDLNNDGKHNVLDLILCALHLGQHW